MSQQARHLADVYSNDNAPALSGPNVRPGQRRSRPGIVEDLHACRDIRRWASQIELEESIVASQLSQLDEQLQAALPALGYSFEGFDAESDQRGDNVVALTQKPAAE